MMMRAGLLCSMVILLLLANRASARNFSYIKGIDFFAFTDNVISSPAFIQELVDAKTLGANFAVLNYLIYTESATSNGVFSGVDTPTYDALTSFITAAHKLGLGVFLKPVIVCPHDCIMIDLMPSNLTLWFENYTSYIVELASFAEELEVEALSVALELWKFSNTSYDEWANLVFEVRLSYSGLLTYCSIFWPVETQQVLFWDQLDFIAMDTYVPFWNGTYPLPTQDYMNARYTYYLNLVDEWHQSQQPNVSSLPIVLSEVGYPSRLDGLINPAADAPDECPTAGNFAPNFTVQEMAWEAVFTGIGSSKIELQGVVIFWWDNPSTSDYCGNKTSNNYGCNWTPRGKPAEQIIANAWDGTLTNSCN